VNYIELFAGCGGLSLGLESSGFKLAFANELSPMAAETYAYNILRKNLRQGLGRVKNVHWLSSDCLRSDHEGRLKENPLDSAGLDGHICDLDKVEDIGKALRGALLVGSILDLNRIIERKGVMTSIKNSLPRGEVDLISGGPPCQSFSMAGLRQHANQRNSLPWAFAEFVRKLNPKMAILENVSGILRAFNVDGEKHYAWYEVAKAFAVEKYVPICLHVNAKYAGAAQNRPRFIMLAFRHNIAEKIENKLEKSALREAFTEALRFYDFFHESNEDIPYGHLTCHDIEKNSALFMKDSILAPLSTHRDSKPLVSVEQAIDDLAQEDPKVSPYVDFINRTAFRTMPPFIGVQKNNEPRKNGPVVQARFHLYQIMRKVSSSAQREIRDFLRTGNPTLITKESLDELSQAGWPIPADGDHRDIFSRRRLLEALEPLRSKKRTQHALVAGKPAPAALSIPDDACHYRDGILRTLTVREMARIQSFPDWFVFRNKITTGGRMRRFQVPQYTQVGNAVPPLLGKALGEVCKAFLKLAK